MINKTTYAQNNSVGSSFLSLIAKESSNLTIKIFNIKGKKAKTINKYADLKLLDFKGDMYDLEKGQYILNAFQGGNFIKSFKFVKD